MVERDRACESCYARGRAPSISHRFIGHSFQFESDLEERTRPFLRCQDAQKMPQLLIDFLRRSNDLRDLFAQEFAIAPS